MSQKTCPTCGKELIPIWEKEKIKCKKCNTKIEIKNLGKIEKDKLQDWDRSDLIEFINYLIVRLRFMNEQFKELESRIETLGIVVESSE